MFGGFTIDKRCEKIPRIAPRAQRQANTPFKSGKWQSHFAISEWFSGQVCYKRNYFAYSEFHRLVMQNLSFWTPNSAIWILQCSIYIQQFISQYKLACMTILTWIQQEFGKGKLRSYHTQTNIHKSFSHNHNKTHKRGMLTSEFTFNLMLLQASLLLNQNPNHAMDQLREFKVRGLQSSPS